MPGGVETSVAAMRAGASDFVQKPIAPDRLLGSLDCVASDAGPQGELRPLTEKLRAPLAFEEIIGSSPNFRSALAIAAKAARARVPVMINGKHGPGTEGFARATHGAPPPHRSAPARVDCSAVSPGLMGAGRLWHERTSGVRG